MISIADHLDVPQYIAIPWLITWVIALTISVNIKYQRVDTLSIIEQMMAPQFQPLHNPQEDHLIQVALLWENNTKHSEA